MKKYLLVFIFFICTTFALLDVSAASWRYEWSNGTVEIPVGESLEDYKYKPIATLYKDNCIVSDTSITYLRDGDWMYYLADVNTSVVGEYEVWYKAYENTYKPGTCPGYKCKIKFIVKDVIAPTIQVLNPSIRLRMGDTYNFNENIAVNDNYDTNPRVQFSNTIDMSKVGAYRIDVYAIDFSGNKSSVSFDVEIYGVEPILIYKNEGNPIIVQKDSSCILSDYFSASDLIDGDLTSKITSSPIDTSTIGKKDIVVCVENSNHMKSEIIVSIMVVDDIKPTITLSTTEVLLDYLTDFKNYDFMQYIQSIEDNDEINYDNLKITNNILNSVGYYYVKYKYTDLSFTVEEAISIHLISYQKPRITTTPVVCIEGEPVDLWNYFSVEDASDENILDEVVLNYEEVDFFTTGLYYAEVYAINSSGLSTTAQITITVKPAVVEEEAVKANTFFSSEEGQNDIKDYFLIGIILVLLGIISYQFISNKKKKSI